MTLKPPADPNTPLGEDRVYWNGVEDGGMSTGASNNATALNALTLAVNSAGGGTIFIPDGTFDFTSSVTLYSNTHLLLSPGCVLDFSGMAAGSQNSNTCIVATGTESATKALTANAVEGDASLTVAAGDESVCAAGDYVRVGSDAYFMPSATPGTLRYKVGEFCRVTSTSSGSITLTGSLASGPYNTADSAVVSKLTLLTNITVEGGRMVGPGTGKECTAVKFDKCRRVRVLGTKFENFDFKAVDFADCIDANADGISVDGGTSASTGFYGVAFSDATQDSRCVNSFFRSCRHAVTTDYASASGSNRGIPRRIAFSHNQCVEQTDTAIDFHGGGEDVVAVGNTVINPTNHGVSLRCPSGVITGNTIRHPGASGIVLRNQSDKATRYTVGDNLIVNPGSGQYGIYYLDPTDAALSGTSAGQLVEGVAITGNVIRGSTATTEGIYCVSAESFALSNINITGNTLYQRGIRLDNVTAAVVTGNNCSAISSGSGVHLNACTESQITNNRIAFAASGGGNGIRVRTTSSGVNIRGNRLVNCTNGVTIENTVTDCTVQDNDARGFTSSAVTYGTGTGHIGGGNRPQAFTTVASAATVTLPYDTDVISVTGTADITSITADYAGRRVTLKFNSTAATSGLVDGSNLKLASTLAYTADDTITLVSDGTNWIEAARSVN